MSDRCFETRPTWDNLSDRYPERCPVCGRRCIHENLHDAKVDAFGFYVNHMCSVSHRDPNKKEE